MLNDGVTTFGSGAGGGKGRSATDEVYVFEASPPIPAVIAVLAPAKLATPSKPVDSVYRCGPLSPRWGALAPPLGPNIRFLARAFRRGQR
ncbi:hypothetical protein BRADI_2g42372v3 [Brachypodium distachyon]|uniref:Uncharacterized protein n=1 Tax=Brachypodium distachyon TaxID=15368 RepID=A0A2K2DDF4_BRADI|nr:hypothetical protein BRADI_2g42372v3 [Brachypodium distachyon]